MNENDIDDDSDLEEDFDQFNALTESESDLLDTIYEGPRIIVMNSDEDPTLVGVVMDENQDSFLVRLLSRMVSVDGGDPEIKPYILSHSSRIFKTSVKMLLPLTEPFYGPYIKYLETEGVKHFPNLLDDIFLPDELEAKEQSTEETDSESLVTGPGLTKEEANERLTKAMEQGRFHIHEFSTKH